MNKLGLATHLLQCSGEYVNKLGLAMHLLQCVEVCGQDRARSASSAVLGEVCHNDGGQRGDRAGMHRLP